MMVFSEVERAEFEKYAIDLFFAQSGLWPGDDDINLISILKGYQNEKNKKGNFSGGTSKTIQDRPY